MSSIFSKLDFYGYHCNATLLFLLPNRTTCVACASMYKYGVCLMYHGMYFHTCVRRFVDALHQLKVCFSQIVRKTDEMMQAALQELPEGVRLAVETCLEMWRKEVMTLDASNLHESTL
jgi:hypothetical protein